MVLPAREGAVTEVNYFAPNCGREKKSGGARHGAGRGVAAITICRTLGSCDRQEPLVCTPQWAQASGMQVHATIDCNSRLHLTEVPRAPRYCADPLD